MSRHLLAGVLALSLAAPLVALLSALLVPTGEVWRHLLATVFPEYVRNSLLLVAGVGTGTLALAVPSAFLMARHAFPGRRILEVAFLLPLAFPPYLLAYCLTDALHETGAIYAFLASEAGLEDVLAHLPSIRSLPGAILVLSASLYPYVFLLLRAALGEYTWHLDHAAATLGAGPLRRLARIHWPLLRPTLVAGLALVAMEVLGDFGTVDYFAVDTLSTGIFRTWLGLGNRAASAQMALLLLGLVAILLAVERLQRANRKAAQALPRSQPACPAGVVRSALIWLWSLIPVGIGFLLPISVLLFNARHASWDIAVDACARTLLMAGSAALLVVAVGTVLAMGTVRSPAIRALHGLSALGYAFPGAVLAVAVLTLFESASGLAVRFGTAGFVASGSLGALFYAYTVRFAAIPFQGISGALSRVSSSWEESAQLLGASSWTIQRRIVLPHLRPSLVATLIMVFVECAKELPATMILRPFNFETLALQTYTLASDERLHDAAPLGLCLVGLGLVPLAFLSRLVVKRENGHA